MSLLHGVRQALVGSSLVVLSFTNKLSKGLKVGLEFERSLGVEMPQARHERYPYSEKRRWRGAAHYSVR